MHDAMFQARVKRRQIARTRVYLSLTIPQHSGRAMKKSMRNDAIARARMLDDTVFLTIREILFRDTEGSPRANARELEVLLAISWCAGASVETKAFARKMWLQLSCPGIRGVSKSSIEDGFRFWGTPKAALLEHFPSESARE